MNREKNSMIHFTFLTKTTDEGKNTPAWAYLMLMFPWLQGR